MDETNLEYSYCSRVVGNVLLLSTRGEETRGMTQDCQSTLSFFFSSNSSSVLMSSIFSERT